MATVTLLLAYAPGRPDGDVEDRIELQVALNPQGHLDEQAYAEAPSGWSGRRTLPDGTARNLELVRLDGTWALRSAHQEDDPLWDFEGRVFRPGEYATLRRPGGEELVFRIVAVDPEASA